jgi:3'(2'), 5'-bisphosphate nucleotidase
VFTAAEGLGAQVWPVAGGSPPVRLACSGTDDPSAARFCESVESGHSSHADSSRVARALGITSDPVRLDSQAKYAVVGRGQAEIYMRLPTRPGYVERIWDHAAGYLVITEAGGRVTDIDGVPLDFGRGAGLENNRGIIATNGVLHSRVLNALRETGVARERR